jgi:hypothetical protein
MSLATADAPFPFAHPGLTPMPSALPLFRGWGTVRGEGDFGAANAHYYFGDGQSK